MAVGSFVQTATVRINPGTSGSVSFASNTVAGDFLSLLFWTYGATTLSFSDASGNVWKQVGTTLVGAVVKQAQLFYVSSCVGGPVTLNLSSSSNVQFCARIAEYSGPFTLDNSVTNTTSVNNTAFSIGPVTTSGSSELLLTMVATSASPNTLTSSTGDTVDATGVLDFLLHRITGNPGSYSVSTSNLASIQYTGFEAAFTQGTGNTSGWVNAHRDFVNKRGAQG